LISSICFNTSSSSDPILDIISVLSVVLALRCESTSVSVSVDATLILPVFFFWLFFFSGKAGEEEIAGGGS